MSQEPKDNSAMITALAEQVGSVTQSVRSLASSVSELSADVKAIGRAQAATEANAGKLPFGTLFGGAGLVLAIMGLYVSPIINRVDELERDRKATTEEILPGVSQMIADANAVAVGHEQRIAENERELESQWEETFTALDWRGAMRERMNNAEAALVENHRDIEKIKASRTSDADDRQDATLARLEQWIRDIDQRQRDRTPVIEAIQGR